MKDRLSIALAQVNPTVGDVEGNLAKVREARTRAAAERLDLVVFPELVMAGYPPEDLVLKPAFQNEVEQAVLALAGETGDGGPALVIGAPWREEGALYNASLLLDGGGISAARYKYHLPNYGVFDEKRVFHDAPLPEPVDFRGVSLGLLVCEDMWLDDVTEHLHDAGAEILIVSNGSPYESDKEDDRLALAGERVQETGLPLVYVNQIGGQDELVFDGGSFVLGGDGVLAARAPDWVEDLLVTNWRLGGGHRWVCEEGPQADHATGAESIYLALVTGLRDYVNKNRFDGVILGLSGGIDSALSAAVAVDALGSPKVRCVLMPSRYTADESVEDANACAELLGVRLGTIPIGGPVDAFTEALAGEFAEAEPDTTEENIQARTRGLIIMALSNKFGHMALTTGNKSEMSVGYATLYGDMCGGFSVLKDVYKMTVYELARWRNEHMPLNAFGPQGRVIPERILDKPPSAELKPDQTDQDSLPPYKVLDAILGYLVEEDMAVDDIVARGHDRETVARIEHMLYVAEYKRRQSPPGVKITRRGFGRDRRYPITNGFRDAR